LLVILYFPFHAKVVIRCLRDRGTAPGDDLLHSLAALRAFGKGSFADPLEGFKSVPAFGACTLGVYGFIFIYGHYERT
jgi:hypothetical protein